MAIILKGGIIMSILDKIIKTALFIEKTAALDVWRVYDRNFVGTVQMNLNSESAIYVVKSTKFSPNKEILPLTYLPPNP